jgi:hypothetical protein
MQKWLLRSRMCFCTCNGYCMCVGIRIREQSNEIEIHGMWDWTEWVDEEETQLGMMGCNWGWIIIQKRQKTQHCYVQANLTKVHLGQLIYKPLDSFHKGVVGWDEVQSRHKALCVIWRIGFFQSVILPHHKVEIVNFNNG